ncbi:MAG: hydantoinase B/oxoprolinase family protein [Gammaproteobacteria bacterium]
MASALADLEIIEGKLLAAVDEMGVVLARTSMSPVIYEVLDFACGICDARGQLIAQSNGLTLFTGTFSGQVRFIARKFDGQIRPGDAFITNDPFEGGTHACDMAVVQPIFVAGELVAYSIAVAHWLDVGGAIPGSLPPDAVDTFQEGLRLPGMRLCVDNELRPEITDLIRANVRLPALALGDLNAELAATRIGQRRMEAICERYGANAVTRAFESILELSERRSRTAVASLPDGVYEATDTIDGDGVCDEQIPVRVAVAIDGERICFDFTGCAATRRGPINCSRGALLSAVKTVFKALVEPHAPSNDGWFKPLEIEIPDGTVFSARAPAPVGWYYEGSAQASELVWKALAPLAPERFSAGSYMSLCATYLCGRRPGGGDLFVHIEPQHGGWGATESRDGASALIAVADGDTYNYSVELLEAIFPLRVRKYSLNVGDGAGAGRCRGGFGVVREYEILTGDASFYGSLGRSRERPWGLDGGTPGTLNYVDITSKSGSARVARTTQIALSHGDIVRIVTGGGGGWGDPRERPVEAVQRDVLNGYVDAGSAKVVYGVERTRPPGGA